MSIEPHLAVEHSKKEQVWILILQSVNEVCIDGIFKAERTALMFSLEEDISAEAAELCHLAIVLVENPLQTRYARQQSALHVKAEQMVHSVIL